MSFEPKNFTFTVDLRGLIDLMGTSLYSKPCVAIRELIQNAHDGIVRRRMKDLNYTGAIRFRQDAARGIMQIEDDGIGLTAAEAEKYLSTLGAGITGMLRRETKTNSALDDMGLIGQFGIGLLSAFLFSDEIIVESLKADGCSDPIRWVADAGTTIHLAPGEKTTPGTTVTLRLRPEQIGYAKSEELLEESINEYADFLNVPIYLGDREQRVNLMEPAWFDPEADEEKLLPALENWFNELPLCVIPIRREKPITIQGALYISPERLPGFSRESMVAVTIRRMIISRSVQKLIPPWAPFVRGVLELPECRPTASREELVQDESFELVRKVLEEELFNYFERLIDEKPTVWESLLSWHRYMLAGAAIENVRLRKLLRRTYLFSTHCGRMVFYEILRRSTSRSLKDRGRNRVVWYHGDRRQEPAMDSIFMGIRSPCVHATSTFEETLLHAMSLDREIETGEKIECRIAVPGSKDFTADILRAKNQRPLDDRWEMFFESLDCKIYTAECESPQPVFAFLNERQDLIRTVNALKKEGTIPFSFQRMIDKHLDGEEMPRNELLLNRSHLLIARALESGPTSPLAAVMRILIFQVMQSAGARLGSVSREELDGDLLEIANAF